MKKLLSILSTVLLLLFSAPQAIAFFSSVAPSGQRLYYDIVDGNARVIYQNSGSPSYSNISGSLTIPTTVTHSGTTYDVTLINESAFNGCTGLTSVTIPNSVTSIGNYAFQDCTGLTSVSIGNSVTSIGSSAFSGCTGLTGTLTIPNSVTYIFADAFKNCTGLTALNIGASVTSIRSSAFYGCTGLTGTLIIPNSVTSIGNYAFQNCTGLTSVSIGNSVTSIGIRAFSGCTGLTDTLTIPNSVTSIGNYAFQNCTGLTALNIGTSVTTIGDYAFLNCAGLTAITIPDFVTYIGKYAFKDCTELTSITIGASVDTIGDHAFNGCIGLTTVNFNATNCTTMKIDGAILENPFRECTSFTTLNIGDNVQTIPDYAFYGCTSLTTVNFNATNCTTMGSSSRPVFSNCTSLSTLNIADNVKKIPDYAFSNCVSLTSVTVPDSVTSIGICAFRKCLGLTSLAIGNSVTTIGDSAFQNCSGLTSLTLGNSIYEIKGYAFSGCTSLTSVTIPTSVRYIRGCVFADCTGLTTVNFNASIGSIMGSTTHPNFSNCTSFTTLNIGDNVQKIPECAFYGCTGLTSVTIPSSVTTIRDHAFQNCTGLTSVTLGNSVTEIGLNAFNGCTGLTSVTIPNSVTTIKSSAFRNCTGLTSVSLGNSVTEIGLSAFNGCTGLTSVTIPNSVTTIRSYAFYGCTGLTSVTIGYSVSKIWKYAFGECVGMTEIHLLGNSVPQCVMNDYTTNYAADSIFYGVLSDIPIYVPCGRVNVYRTKWTYFSNYNERNIYAVNTYSADPQMGIAEITIPYTCNTLQPQVTATANSGYMFDHWSNGVVDNPYTILIVNKDTTLVAYFYPIHSLSVSTDNTTMGYAEGGGIIREGDSAWIHAEANYGYHFSHWNDGNTDNPRSITITQDTAFTAFFAPNQYALTLQSNNDAIGTVSGNGVYDYLDTALISATPIDHCHFVRWSDNNTENPRRYVITDNITLTAIFAHDQHTVILNVDNASHGTVSGGGNREYGSPCTIMANANHGYYFTHWNDGDTNNPRTFIVEQDTGFTAFFETCRYTLNVQSNNDSLGIVSEGGTYNYLDTVTIFATVISDHCYFARWSDNNTENPRRYVITDNTTLTAIFAYDQHSVTLSVDNASHGTVSGGGNREYGSPCTIMANANHGYYFTHWDDGDTNNPRTFIVTQDTGFTAFFETCRYTLNVQSNNDSLGIVSEGGTYNYLDTVTIFATAISNHCYFARWSDNNTENPRRYVITDNITLTAIFAYDQHAVTLNVDNTSHGTVSGGGNHEYGSLCTITANANNGYHFTHWNDGDTNNPRTFIVTQDTIFTAFYSPNQYLLTLESNDTTFGIVVGGGVYEYLETVTATALAAEHYHFDQWNNGSTQNPRQISVIGNLTYTAYFSPNNYTISVISNNNSQGRVSGGGNFTYLSTCTITATANNGYHFTHWQDGNIDNPRTITVTGDSTYRAYFAYGANEYTIDVLSNNPTMGDVTGGGVYTYGSNITISAEPSDSYRFVNWQDGNTDNPRTIAVTENATYTAYFEANEYIITVLSDNPTMGTVSGGGTYTYGSTISISAQPSDGCWFDYWQDGNNYNPRTITVTGNAEYVAHFYRPNGIDDVETVDNLKIYSRGNTIVIDFSGQQAAGSGQTVVVYDVMGRVIKQAADSGLQAAVEIPVTAAGVYMVKVGDQPSRKVVVRP